MDPLNSQHEADMFTGQDILGASHNLPDKEFHQFMKTLTVMITQSLM